MMLSEEDVEQMEKPNLWGEHNCALKHPEYQMEGMMDCLREEMMMNMPICENIPQETHFVDTQWSRRQWGIINQLRGELNFLTSKVNEMRANASKRRPKTKY